MNRTLKNDLTYFLDTYYSFSINEEKSSNNYLVLQGKISIIDKNSQLWDNYHIRIHISKNNYPYIIPDVYETSTKIERSYDFHISKEGKCCLDIMHKLILEKRRGITLVDFYKKYIYPFFANHQYKLKTKLYAGSEYKHDIDGIFQYYKEEYNLQDPLQILTYLKHALGEIKAERNKKCPICGGLKYKKCCMHIVDKLSLYGNKQLKIDHYVFKEKLKKESSEKDSFNF